MSALHIAIQNRNIEVIKLLLSNDKIDVNLKNVYSFLNNLYNF